MSDWADEIAENMRGEDDELLPFVCLAPVAKALRKAKADGMREAAEVMDDTPTPEEGWGSWANAIAEVRRRAAEIEKGNA